MISKDVADILISYLSSTEIILEIDFNLEKAETVKVNVFYGTGDYNICPILSGLRKYMHLIMEPKLMNYKHAFFNEEDPTFI